MPGEYRGRITMGSGGGRGPGCFDVVEDGQPPGEASMRELRRLQAGAVAVVTSRDERGLRGITVTAFCVVSLAPPTILACLARDGEALAAVRGDGAFAVSVLSDSQEFLAERFAGRAPLVNPRFEGVAHRLTRGGRPVLEDCLVWFDCRAAAFHDGGDHVIVIGEVREAGHGSGGEPLLYFDGSYRELGRG